MVAAQRRESGFSLVAGIALAATCLLIAWAATASCRARCDRTQRWTQVLPASSLSSQLINDGTNGTDTLSGVHRQGLGPRAGMSPDEEQRWDAYQDQMVAATARWRFRPIANSHQMTASFLDFWTVQRAHGRIVKSRIYLPIDWFECIYNCKPEDTQQLQEFFHGLDRSFTYFTLFGFDCGMNRMGLNIALDMDIMVFSSDGCTRGARDVRIPLMMDVLDPSSIARDIHVSAAFSERSHAVRTQLARVWDTWSSEPGFLRTNFTSKQEYADLLRRSNFTLCPRGLGPTSYRFYEALQVGTVPIFIWKYDVPLAYPELLDWNEIAIVCHADDMDSLRQRINDFDLARAQRRMKELAHMWTYSFINEYAMRRLESESIWPVPKSPYSAM